LFWQDKKVVEGDIFCIIHRSELMEVFGFSVNDLVKVVGFERATEYYHDIDVYFVCCALHSDMNDMYQRLTIFKKDLAPVLLQSDNEDDVITISLNKKEASSS
jgi:hypothetical protein